MRPESRVVLIFRLLFCFLLTLCYTYCMWLKDPYPVVPDNSSWADGTSLIDLALYLLLVLHFLLIASLTPPSMSSNLVFDQYVWSIEGASLGSTSLLYWCFQNVSPTTRQALSVCILVGAHVYMGWTVLQANSGDGGNEGIEDHGNVSQKRIRKGGATGTTGKVHKSKCHTRRFLKAVRAVFKGGV